MTGEHQNDHPSSNNNEFELSRDALEGAWRDLADALKTRGDYSALEALYPSQSGAESPRFYSQELNRELIQEVLADPREEGQATEGRAEYITSHKIDEEDTETREVVAASWGERLPGDQEIHVFYYASMVRIEDHIEGSPRFEASKTTEYARQFPDGSRQRISPNDRKYLGSGRDSRRDVVEGAVADEEARKNELTLDDLERIHQLAERLRRVS